ncbi:hypothetical protein EDD11_000789 [Mortierella claussenii]|nr:hypothetical protein EDD11_000789 [Mortierella claussenii]
MPSSASTSTSDDLDQKMNEFRRMWTTKNASAGPDLILNVAEYGTFMPRPLGFKDRSSSEKSPYLGSSGHGNMSTRPVDWIVPPSPPRTISGYAAGFGPLLQGTKARSSNKTGQYFQMIAKLPKAMSPTLPNWNPMPPRPVTGGKQPGKVPAVPPDLGATSDDEDENDGDDDDSNSDSDNRSRSSNLSGNNMRRVGSRRGRRRGDASDSDRDSVGHQSPAHEDFEGAVVLSEDGEGRGGPRRHKSIGRKTAQHRNSKSGVVGGKRLTGPSSSLTATSSSHEGCCSVLSPEQAKSTLPQRVGKAVLSKPPTVVRIHIPSSLLSNLETRLKSIIHPTSTTPLPATASTLTSSTSHPLRHTSAVTRSLSSPESPSKCKSNHRSGATLSSSSKKYFSETEGVAKRRVGKRIGQPGHSNRRSGSGSDSSSRSSNSSRDSRSGSGTGSGSDSSSDSGSRSGSRSSDSDRSTRAEALTKHHHHRRKVDAGHPSGRQKGNGKAEMNNDHDRDRERKRSIKQGRQSPMDSPSSLQGRKRFKNEQLPVISEDEADRVRPPSPFSNKDSGNIKGGDRSAVKKELESQPSPRHQRRRRSISASVSPERTLSKTARKDFKEEARDGFVKDRMLSKDETNRRSAGHASTHSRDDRDINRNRERERERPPSSLSKHRSHHSSSRSRSHSRSRSRSRSQSWSRMRKRSRDRADVGQRDIKTNKDSRRGYEEGRLAASEVKRPKNASRDAHPLHHHRQEKTTKGRRDKGRSRSQSRSRSRSRDRNRGRGVDMDVDRDDEVGRDRKRDRKRQRSRSKSRSRSHSVAESRSRMDSGTRREKEKQHFRDSTVAAASSNNNPKATTSAVTAIAAMNDDKKSRQDPSPLVNRRKSESQREASESLSVSTASITKTFPQTSRNGGGAVSPSRSSASSSDMAQKVSSTTSVPNATSIPTPASVKKFSMEDYQRRRLETDVDTPKTVSNSPSMPSSGAVISGSVNELSTDIARVGSGRRMSFLTTAEPTAEGQTKFFREYNRHRTLAISLKRKADEITRIQKKPDLGAIVYFLSGNAFLRAFYFNDRHFEQLYGNTRPDLVLKESMKCWSSMKQFSSALSNQCGDKFSGHGLDGLSFLLEALVYFKCHSYANYRLRKELQALELGRQKPPSGGTGGGGGGGGGSDHHLVSISTGLAANMLQIAEDWMNLTTKLEECERSLTPDIARRQFPETFKKWCIHPDDIGGTTTNDGTDGKGIPRFVEQKQKMIVGMVDGVSVQEEKMMRYPKIIWPLGTYMHLSNLMDFAEEALHEYQVRNGLEYDVSQL